MQPSLKENLEQWGKIEKYSYWMYSQYEKHIGKRVLDIGSGIGNMLRYFIDCTEISVATDIFPDQIQIIKDRFKDKNNFDAFCSDISSPDFTQLRSYKFDTIICINVLEHIQDDLKALENMKACLNVDGKIIIVVPAFGSLYNYMDTNAGHFRRYNRNQLRKLAEQTKLNVVDHKYFNLLGIPVYYIKGKITAPKKRLGTFSTTLTENNSRWYNFATCVMKPIENLIRAPVGLSEIIVLKKS